MSEDWNQRVWALVAAVPRGHVVSYSGVAAMLGFPRRARHVSRALKQAPDDLDLPWQRVINAQGKIAFPPGSIQAGIQRTLLEEEGVVFGPGGKVAWSQFGWQP